MSRAIVLSCSLLAIAACRSKSEPPHAEPAPRATASVPPAPSSTPAPAPSVPEGAALPVDRPKTSLGLKLALTVFPPEFPSNYGRGVFNVHAVRGGTMVTLGEALYALEGGKLLEITMGVGEQRLGTMMIGPIYAELGSVSGRYPGELWVDADGMWVSDGARIHAPWSGTYRERDGAWVQVSQGQPGFASRRMVAWSGGRSVGWGGGGFELVGGSKKQPLPARTPGQGNVARVAVEAIAALPSGDLYAIGEDSEKGGAFAIEHWTDDSPKAVGVHGLPSWFCKGPGTVATQGAERVALLAASPRAVFAVCRSKLEAGLLRFDGNDATVLPPPATGKVAGAAVGEDGSLWLVTPSAAFVLGPLGAWHELSVPNAADLRSTIIEGSFKPEGALKLELSSVAATTASRGLIAGSLYDANFNAQSTFLFTSDGTKLELPPADERAPAPAPSSSALAPPGTTESAEGRPLGVDCKTPFVVLYSVSDSAPPDYAYPATRDALASAAAKPAAQFVEFRFQQRRTLGAKVSTTEQAKALVDLITARVKGSKPTALCLDPTPALIRELEL